ncbi:MAG: archease [Nanoarchaeota archaeon]|nr:archease [Nanoarchaeota archaeon]
MRFKFFPHTADIKFRSYGETLEEAFENSAYALFSSICEDKVKEKKNVKISVSGNDLSSLLYNFLEELLFLVDSKDFLLSKIKGLKINKKSFKLNCEATGDSGKNYEVYSHIKAVTYNEMFIRKVKDKWIIQIVLDV